jgi:colanic acid/amylovoran biosynthesis glycosyltransferase
LNQLIGKLGLEKQVFLTGFKSQEEIILDLHKSDIFLYTPKTPKGSKQDGIANVLKEAMATGLVPITTNHGGNSEIIQDGKNGFLIPEGEIEMFVKKILYLIENAEKRLEMGKYAAEYIQKEFCKEIVNEKLITIMQKIITEHKELEKW